MTDVDSHGMYRTHSRQHKTLAFIQNNLDMDVAAASAHYWLGCAGGK